METEYLVEQLGESAEELSVINRSSTIITSSLNIQVAFERFIEELRKLVDVSWAAVTLIVDSDLYFLALCSGIGSAWQVGERVPIKGTGTEWVVAHKKATVESDLSQESRFVTGDCYLQQGVRSIAYLPLIAIEKAIGSLIVASCKPSAYSQRHTALLEQLASQIAIPVRHSRLYAEVHEMARIDALTGLLNRHSLNEVIASEINRHSRYGGVFSLIILDLDSFKAFNDKYGHPVGDGLLREIGTIIKNMIRSADLAFRYGADEFAILLPNTSVDAANQVAERLQKQLASGMIARNIMVTASLGLASWPIDGLVANEVTNAADVALYHAKRSGGNQSQSASRILPSLDYTKVSSVNSQDDKALNAVYALAAIVDARNYYNRSHWRKVKEYVTYLAKGLNMEPVNMEKLQTCALLHDIGKIAISDKIISKRGRLSDDEWEVIRAHPQVGTNIISHAYQLAPCIPGILHHHERYDGSGYPEGLQGEHIPLDARIMRIADSFAAMTSDRSYSDALTPQVALEEIKQGASTQFDPNLVEVFLSTVKNTLLLPQKRGPG